VNQPPAAPVTELPEAPAGTSTQELSDAFVIGMINAIVSIPCTLAYVAIMFPSKRFLPFMPSLSRLVFFGSAIHQVTFSILSSLPFAIGQVQDVGLIFLSAMSSSIAALVPVATPERPGADAAMVTTTLLAMTLSTAFTGGLLVFVGRCAA
jgi:sulfate permease, SulP family